MKCRHCNSEVTQPFCDLACSPPSNAYLSDEQLDAAEIWAPLRTYVCGKCFLVQTQDFHVPDELFVTDYGYFSATSASWLKHCEAYVNMISQRLELDASSLVVELASNDGYLLQYVKELGIPCLGVEPTQSTAEAARAKGIEVISDFFGTKLAGQLVEQGRQADLIIGNNVLAHVPDINDFLKGVTQLLAEDGVATFEFPHLLQLIKFNQFDTIYHEHYSYLSLLAVETISRAAGLTVFDVEKLTTHGGSLRVYLQRSDTGQRPQGPNVPVLQKEELDAGLADVASYGKFQSVTSDIKFDLLEFLLEQRQAGKKVAAYGAAAKGNTLLNFSGVRSDMIPYVVDRSPGKLGRNMPGSRIPIVAEERIREDKPDYIIILPWNIADEIETQLAYVREWGAKFVRAIPELRVW
ncbi:class I SAM-dependent methyltransferase [Thalassospira sp. A3_1]|uniref:class I SAM-dependent methyltransferase n=1 Tax=Thalassospira sp. A3_1 TaxID=2821088 RepID=UPI001ADCDA0D|nr:class I SAM-dependent methyltransferase [Thalassospira sp. A3_1]MBO9506229.1 class I SAM-dependent methyltransferase [Thalassospira sp. A3_1]